MSSERRTRRDAAEQMLAEEIDRELAMSMVGVNRRSFVIGVVAASVGVTGALMLLLCLADSLHG